MVVPQGELPILTIKTMAAEIVPSRRTDAVTPPITNGLNNFMELGVVRIYRAAFAHGHMVRRIEARRSNITDRTGKIFLPIELILGPQSIAVVFHQPQIMRITELLDRREIKGIPQCMRDHDSLCLFRECFFQTGYVNVVLRNRDIDKDRNRPILDNRRNRRRKSRRHRDDLIPTTDSTLPQKR